MQAFAVLSLVAAASAAPQLLSAPKHVVLGHTAHVPVAHHAVAHHAVAHPVAHHAVAHHAPLLHHAPVAHHAVAHHAPVVAHAVHHAAPVVHAAPAYHAPVAHAVAEVYPDEISPYTYNYAVADDYSKSNFNAAESNDGTGVVEGSYSVALPDGRIQHVNYHVNDYDGYVAEVTYDAQAQSPAAAPYAPAPAYHA